MWNQDWLEPRLSGFWRVKALNHYSVVNTSHMETHLIGMTMAKVPLLSPFYIQGKWVLGGCVICLRSIAGRQGSWIYRHWKSKLWATSHGTRSMPLSQRWSWQRGGFGPSPLNMEIKVLGSLTENQMGSKTDEPSAVQKQALVGSQELIAHILSNSAFADIMLVAWNQLQWEWSHHGNQQVLQIRDYFFSESWCTRIPLIRLELTFTIKYIPLGLEESWGVRKPGTSLHWLWWRQKSVRTFYKHVLSSSSMLYCR